MTQKITTTNNVKQGRLYAGPTLPQGAKIVGTATRDGHDTGALVELPNGRQVQYNAGVIRNLPGVMGRPPMSAESTTTLGVRLPQSVYDRIPEPRSEWVRKLIIDNL